MSMWEFEALAEECVAMVGASDLPRAEKRDAYASIYALIEAFDVSFVHFRSTRALTEAEFFHRIDITDHPDYAAHRAYFDGAIEEGESAWISVPRDGSDDYMPPDGLYEPSPHEADIKPGLWFDSTMPLWSRAVEAGLLTGLAAEPVTVSPPKETIASMMLLAAGQGKPRHGLLKMLHGTAAYAFLDGRDSVPKPGDETLTPPRDLPELAVALSTPQEDWIDERFDARNALDYADGEGKAFLEWWCEPYP